MAVHSTLSRVLLYSLLLFAGAVTLSRCDVPEFCNATDYTLGPADPAVPQLPSQFSSTVQAVILDNPHYGGARELSVREYFDEPGNRGRLEYAYNGSSVYVIYDYDDKELFFIDSEGCTVEETTEDNILLQRTFGFRVQDGAPHIGTVSQYFETDQGNFTFMGTEDLRGIPCNRWQSCTISPNRSYTLDYYFSTTDADIWRSAYANDPVPVMITLQGNREDTDSNETIIVRSVRNTYIFTDFNSGPDSVPDSVFEVPRGLVCKGRFPGRPLPSLPNYFTAFFEDADEDDRTVSIYKEYYDFDFQLFRVDYYSTGDYGLPTGPFTYIQDFNLETQYTINRHYRNCSVKPIKPSGIFDLVVVDGRPTLSSPAQLFFIANATNYSYEGVSTVRGVQVDSWISYTDFKQLYSGVNITDTTHELFFTRPEWTIGTHSSVASSEPTLWRTRSTGTAAYFNSTTNNTETLNFTSTDDVFAFNRGEPDLDVFDTSVCVPVGQFYIVTLFLPVEGVRVDFLQLPRNVRSAVSGYTGVRPLQVGNIEVLGGNATVLLLSLHISNLSNVSLSYIDKPVSAYEAVTKLGNYARENNDKLDFPITLSASGQTTPLLMVIRNENGTVYVGFDHTERNSESDSGGLSDGAVAGIAVWMLVLGLGIGIIGTLAILAVIPCIRKRTFTLGGVSYKKHEDEKVTVSTD